MTNEEQVNQQTVLTSMLSDLAAGRDCALETFRTWCRDHKDDVEIILVSGPRPVLRGS
jgi:hypothetical protein